MLTVLAAVLAVTVGLYALKSAWLANALRHRAIAAIERSTGGRAELGSFRYDWRTLTLEFDNLILHGTEPANAPPLFRAPVLRIQLKIASLWKQDIDVTSLVIDQPHVFLLFRPDGTTNIPIAGGHRKKLAIEELVDLRVGHFAINQGTVQTEFRQIPLTARGENLNAVLTYESGPSNIA